MHRLLAAQSGWGKSWYAQAILESNIPEYPVAVVLDHKDEYRGLVEGDIAGWFIAGPRESRWSVDRWADLLRNRPRVVVCRHRLGSEDWRATAGRVVSAARRVGRSAGGGFVALDEAHFLAPQRGSTPDPIKGLATTGRGERISSLWITQRLTELEETVIAQVGERLLGGFSSDRDLAKIEKITEYPTELHNPSLSSVGRLPDSLQSDGENIPLRRFENSGSTVGSEWAFSDDRGNMERRNTRNVDMKTTHHGPEGRAIHDPTNG
jgi:hypothetical protein